MHRSASGDSFDTQREPSVFTSERSDHEAELPALESAHPDLADGKRPFGGSVNIRISPTTAS